MPALVTIVGLGEKRKALIAAGGSELKKELKAAYKKIGEQLAPQVAAKAPRRSGRLARSVRPINAISGPGVRIGNAATAPYAGVVMFGSHGGRERNPFPYRVLEPQLPNIVDQIIEALDIIAEGINNA